MRDYQRRKLHKLVRHLKAEVPLTLPVSVRVMEMPKWQRGWHGCTMFDGYHLTIRIAASNNYATAYDTLIHEWGHARVICAGYEHGDEWGKQQAAAYRAAETFDPKARK